MGEREPPARREKIALRGVAGSGLEFKGLPQRGILQSLRAQGVINGQIEETRAGNIEDFIPIFDKSNVISPIRRITRETVTLLGAAGFVLDIEILAPRDKILVIRALTWETEFGAPGLPISLAVLFVGFSTIPVASRVFFTSNGPFPISNRVIGDVDSSLTIPFNNLLPLALLPQDRLVFRQTISPQAILGSRLNWFEEEYLSPFRPAGL